MKFQLFVGCAIAVVSTGTFPALVAAQTQTYLSQQVGINEISGEFVRMIDDDEFLLRTSNGQIIVVEGDSSKISRVNLQPGEQVTISGQYDNNDFDGYTLTRSNGESFDIRD